MVSNMNERDKSNVLDEKAIHRSPSIVAETSNRDRRIFAAQDLVSLSVDELWTFREEFETLLAAKIAVEITELERRIDRLSVVNGRAARAEKSSKIAKPPRRPYPEVVPKYRSPTPPFETWSGRGKQPRWLNAQLELGKRLEDFKI
jgi:DNA-binding protein H-NS